MTRIVLICHEHDRIDREILAPWLAHAFELVGIVLLRDAHSAMWKRVRNEIRRVGALRFLDVAAFRLYYRLRLARHDQEWTEAEVARWRSRYSAPNDVPSMTASTPNSLEVRKFIASVAPDLMLARCKAILRPEVFTIPRAGTWVLHPGICPEYRNAHGCFWALAKRDLSRVGMTLLQVDRGIDTGPVYLQAGYPFDEVRESHVVIQYRSVLENLPAIEATLRAAANGSAKPITTAGRSSAVWGQPWLSEYLRWKRAAQANA